MVHEQTDEERIEAKKQQMVRAKERSEKIAAERKKNIADMQELQKQYYAEVC